MSEIQTVIEEAKKGILTISDFYKDEVFGYFMAGAIVDIITGLLLLMPTIIIWKFSKREWFADGDGLVVGGALYVTLCILTGIFGFVFFFSGLHDVVMLIVAPKVFITTELVKLFK